MKKQIILFLSVLLVAGCGRNESSENKFRGVQEKHDYASEGINYLKQKDIVRSIQSFDLAIRQDPRNVENYLTLGQVYLHLQQATRAVDTFSAAVKVAPQNADAYYFLALAEAMDNKKPEALESAKKSAELYAATKNEDMFKKSVAIVQGLTQPTATKTQ